MTGFTCRVCGSLLNPDQEYCLLCGTSCSDGVAAQPQEPMSAAKSQLPWHYWVTGGVLLVLVVGVLVLAKTATPTTKASPQLAVPAATSASPTKVSAGTEATGSKPTREEKPRPRRLTVRDLDPCSGRPFPFESALSVSAVRPPAGSDVARAVANIQAILADLGYQGRSRTVPIAVDGWYGIHTEYAVKNFQRDNAIDPVGTIHRITWEALGAYC